MLTKSKTPTKNNHLCRRDFLKSVFTVYGALIFDKLPAFCEDDTQNFQGQEIFRRIVEKAHKNRWQELAIGDLMGKIAKELNGIPYIANTLELSADKEFCVVNFKGLDCVTFFETTLDFARILKKGLTKPEELVKEIEYTRYRDGVLDDFTSRLHYTTDWFVDNQKKNVVEILDLPGAMPFTQKVGVISEHADLRIQLKNHPELVTKIKQQEAAINARQLKYVPKNKINEIESLLKTGDIVGVCTNLTGVDIVHTGLIYCDAQGVRHFMDASSKKTAMQVQIENGPISQSLNWSESLTGAMFARPLEPR